MNREIKFRGKVANLKGNELAGKWIYGYYNVFLSKWNNKHYHVMSSEPRGWLEVDSDTVGQYVGEKDIHGKEIYEGDIVRMNFCGNVRICEVVWSTHHKRFALIGETYIYGFFEVLNLEVIGNIYDNPELKEDGK